MSFEGEDSYASVLAQFEIDQHLNSDVLPAAAFWGRLDVLAQIQRTHFMWFTLYVDTCVCAAVSGHQWEVLLWLQAQGCSWTEHHCSVAARKGHLDVLQWLRKQGCSWDEDTCYGAALEGHLGVLQWAREHGCPWSTRTCSAAAQGGHLDVLQWLRKHGCPWDDWMLWYAACYGHVHILKWARAQDPPCPWNAIMCGEAPDLDTLRWMRQEGCPWDTGTVLQLAISGQLDMVQWALEQGAPCHVLRLKEDLTFYAPPNGFYRQRQWLETHYKIAGPRRVRKWMNVLGQIDAILPRFPKDVLTLALRYC